jgi:hypothetical protein
MCPHGLNLPHFGKSLGYFDCIVVKVKEGIWIEKVFILTPIGLQSWMKGTVRLVVETWQLMAFPFQLGQFLSFM